MAGGTVFGKLKSVIGEISARRRFTPIDRAVLKTMFMLAAVDGEISDDELGRLKEMVSSISTSAPQFFAGLWEAAVRGAGYILLQTRFLSPDELVDTFVKEAYGCFIQELAMERSDERERAVVRLEALAQADGEYSEIEQRCVKALSESVEKLRCEMVSSFYSRAESFDGART